MRFVTKEPVIAYWERRKDDPPVHEFNSWVEGDNLYMQHIYRPGRMHLLEPGRYVKLKMEE